MMTHPQPINLVLGVIGADCHAVGNAILEAFFTEAGFHVINLGVMVSQDELIDAAVESKAKAILVSSLYGHGEMDCAGLREKCRQRGLDRILLYVGGNLAIGKKPFLEVAERFRAMGFDRAFPANAALSDVVELLRRDLAEMNHEVLERVAGRT